MVDLSPRAGLTPASPGQGQGVLEKGLPLLAVLYILSLIIPVNFAVGSIVLACYRLVLLLAFIPLFIGLFTGRFGRVHVFDVLLFAFTLWFAMAMFYHHGVSQVERAGQNAIDSFGAYMLARATIRTPTQFVGAVRVLGLAVLLCLPFAFFEFITARPILNEMLGRLGLSVFPDAVGPPRLGFDRVQGPFEHPILYGVFCSSALAMVYLVRGSLWRTGLVGFAGAMSLSSAALMMLLLQGMLLGWNWITKAIRGRWWLLVACFVGAYVVIDLLSNRTPVQVIISYATFTPGTGYHRLHIWTYGSANVWGSPLFGIGLNDWARPVWLQHSDSVDNYWLAIAMFCGLPGVGLMMGGFALLIRGVTRARFAPGSVEVQCQRAWTIAILATFVALATVHVWNGTYSYLFFLVGMGAWMASWRPEAARTDAPLPEPELRGHARWQGAPARRV